LEPSKNHQQVLKVSVRCFKEMGLVFGKGERCSGVSSKLPLGLS